MLAILLVVGVAVSLTTSGAVASEYAVDPYYFVRKQMLFLGMVLPVVVVMSFLPIRYLVASGIALFVLATGLIIATFFIGVEIKGAQRWIDFGPVSLQPTELLKPALIMITASILTGYHQGDGLSRFWISMGVMGFVAVLILMQPDFGMVMLMSMVWLVQVFMAGVPLWVLLGLGMTGVGLIVGVYLAMPHVRSRIDRFIDPAAGDSYQVDQAREAFLSGGFTGRGIGDGVVKQTLPDAHTDFVFAVIAEELGIIACILLLVLFAMLVMRGFKRLGDQEDHFITLAAGGLLTLIGLQVLINVGVALHVLPTTGMTLPFISYGGSATLGMALVVGFLLSLTRRRQSRLIAKKVRRKR